MKKYKVIKEYKNLEGIKTKMGYEIKTNEDKNHIDNFLQFLLREKYIEEVKEESNWFVPEKNEEYWYITDQKVYRTKKEAEKESKRKQAEIRVLKRITELNKDWKPEWRDNNQKKHYFYYDYNCKKIFIDWNVKCKSLIDNFHFKSIEIGEKIKSEMPEDIKLILEVE